jgi:hypothetical protein
LVVEEILRQRPRREAQALAKPLADGSLTLFHPQTQAFLTLNALAAFIWELSTGQDTLATIIQEVESIFPEQRAVDRDVLALIETLAANEFLTLSDVAPHQDAGAHAGGHSGAARNPFDFFDGIFSLNLDREQDRFEKAMHRYETLGIAGRVERFSAIPTPENHHRGCALSWRAMIAEASRRNCQQLLGLEDDAVFLDDTLAVLRTVTAELARHEWDLCYLGACVWGKEFPSVDGCAMLQVCGPVTCTYAVAVRQQAYARILADVPAGGAAFDAWIEQYRAIDQYLYHMIENGTLRAFITAPRVASQPALLNYDNADRALASRYVI